MLRTSRTYCRSAWICCLHWTRRALTAMASSMRSQNHAAAAAATVQFLPRRAPPFAPPRRCSISHGSPMLSARRRASFVRAAELVRGNHRPAHSSSASALLDRGVNLGSQGLERNASGVIDERRECGAILLVGVRHDISAKFRVGFCQAVVRAYMDGLQCLARVAWGHTHAIRACDIGAIHRNAGVE